jgi:quinol monooxygenase YgiN
MRLAGVVAAVGGKGCLTKCDREERKVVKVIVERRLRPGKDQDFVTLLVELWVKAVRRQGYITGETLRSVEEPDLWLTISSWSDIAAWRSWKESQERQEILKEIEPMLRGLARESVFQQAFKE